MKDTQHCELSEQYDLQYFYFQPPQSQFHHGIVLGQIS